MAGKHNDGGPAFPLTPTDKSGQIGPVEPGMSLRDYYAGIALGSIDQGVIASIPDLDAQERTALMCKISWAMADQMLVERERE